MKKYEDFKWCEKRANKTWGRRFYSSWCWIRPGKDSHGKYYEIYWRTCTYEYNAATKQHTRLPASNRKTITRVYEDNRIWVDKTCPLHIGECNIIRQVTGIQIYTDRKHRPVGPMYRLGDQTVIAHKPVWVENNRMTVEGGEIEATKEPLKQREFYAMVNRIRADLKAREKLGAFDNVEWPKEIPKNGIHKDETAKAILEAMLAIKEDDLRTFINLINCRRYRWYTNRISPTKEFENMLNRHRPELLRLAGAVRYD